MPKSPMGRRAPWQRPTVTPVDSAQKLHPGLVVPPGSGGCTLEVPKLLTVRKPPQSLLQDTAIAFDVCDTSGKALIKVELALAAWEAASMVDSRHPFLTLRAASLRNKRSGPLLASCKLR